jgi:P-type Ca2+ transporter type 2C
LSGPPPRPGGNDVPFLYSGSVLVRGSCVAHVAGTGANTEIGRIGKSLARIEFEETRIKRASRTIAFWMAVMAGAVSAAVVALQTWRTGDLLNALLAGLTIAMSMLPEELPIVLTVFLTLGAWRIAKRQVLTRRIASIESLGAATILCTDKTGTLTVNRMTVMRLVSKGIEYDSLNGSSLPDAALCLLSTAALASQTQAIDPMERAFLIAAPKGTVEEAPPPVQVYGLRPELLAVTHVRQGKEGVYDVVAKGAPEAIAALCKLDQQKLALVLEQTKKMAKEGLRVLGVAEARHDGPLPETPRGFSFTFLGLAGLSDPVRDTVPQAVAECRAAGIRAIMITGDYPETALAIARKAGIGAHRAITGTELEALSDAELGAALKSVDVFARIMPEQKHRIVRVLKEQGDIVAMTGDGVNDAPALKAAHIGIAMGGRGTDVAREAAALVLLDDAFESIVAAIRLGRRIFDNLQKAISFILTVHVPIAGVALAPLLLGWPVVFSPIHIVFLELVIDPICSIAFEAEPEEKGIMHRPPRDPKGPLFSARDIFRSLAHGAFGLLTILAVYGWVLTEGLEEAQARAVAFIAIVAVNFAMILNSRTRRGSLMEAILRPNPVLWAILAATALLLAVSVYFPAAAELFRFTAPPMGYALAALAPSLAVLLAGALTRS